MARKDESSVDKKLSIRELLAIRLLQFMIQVVKPGGWIHDYDELNKSINDLLDKN